MAYIFLSYAHEEFDVAEKLFFALSNLKHQVFFDKKSLQIGDEYNFNIIDSIRKSDFSILLLSPDYFSKNSYCKTELKIIQSNWPLPAGKVFPVMVRETAFNIIPNYLSSVTILKSQGNLIAEVVQRIQDNLLGFGPTDSVTSKIRKLEIEKRIQELDFAWAEQKKKFQIKLNHTEVNPSIGLAVLVFIISLFFAAFTYLFFTKKNPEFFGVWPVVVPAVGGLLSLFIISHRALKLKEAEKLYNFKRKSLSTEMPADNQ